jgi:pimeloyl-ACP methyl ester carboxylesterase
VLHRTICGRNTERENMNSDSNPRSAVKKRRVIGASVIGLGVLALVNAAVARRAERRHPAKGAFLEVDGVRLHYIEKGEGPPVVLLHGNQTMAEDFDLSGVFDMVAQQHRVIAFDRPGFGYSQRPRQTVWTAAAQATLIHNALTQLGVEKPVIVGHSWGGLLALTYALDHPSDTGAVLLLSGYYFSSFRLDVVMASLAAVPILGDVLRYTISPLVGWLTGPVVVKASFAPSRVPRRFKRGFPFSMALRPSQIRATAGDAALMVPCAASMAGRHGELKMPVAIMAGRGDKIVDIPQPERLHANVPQSTLEVIEGTGHMLHYEFPERVAATVEALFTRLQGGNPTGCLAAGAST